MRILSLSKRFVACAIALMVCAMPIFAQKQKQTQVDPATLEFGENLNFPAAYPKGLTDLKAHISAIEASFVKHGFTVGSKRGGEVAVVTIPCEKLFLPDETFIKASGEKYLRPFADFMKYPTMYKMLVAVYSDNTGEDAYSDALTSERANAVEAFLIKVSGMPGKNVVPYGMGQSDPVQTNNSYEGRAANRRVEIYIVPEWQMIDMARSGKLKQE